MSQSLAQIYVHILFSTKERYPFINESIEPELFAYMGDTLKRCGGIPFLINGTPDHVHLLSSLPRTISVGVIMLPFQGDMICDVQIPRALPWAKV